MQNVKGKELEAAGIELTVYRSNFWSATAIFVGLRRMYVVYVELT